MQHNETQMLIAWKNARPIQGLNPDIFRGDGCGALIELDQQNKRSDFGWYTYRIPPLTAENSSTQQLSLPLQWINYQETIKNKTLSCLIRSVGDIAKRHKQQEPPTKRL